MKRCAACSGEAYGERRVEALGGGAGPAMRLGLVECRRCGLVRLVPRMSDEERASYMAAFDRMRQAGLSEKDLRKATRFFSERADLFAGLERGRVLDVGCGPGYFLAVMRERGWEAEGLEPFPASVEDAGRRPGVQVHAVTLEQFQPAKSFDLITLWHVFEHVPDPLGALARCRELLHPGGTLFLEVPNLDGLEARLSGGYWAGFLDPTHRWMYRRRSLEILAERAGFALARCEAVGSASDWYGFKQGLRGRLWQRGYVAGKSSGGGGGPGPLRALLGHLAAFYPVPMALAQAARLFGLGSVLRAWLNPKLP